MQKLKTTFKWAAILGIPAVAGMFANRYAPGVTDPIMNTLEQAWNMAKQSPDWIAEQRQAVSQPAPAFN